MMKLEYNGQFEQQPITDVLVSFLDERLANDPKVVYTDADLMLLSGTGGLWEKYPDRVLNTGIQEGNLVSTSAGFSVAGLTPYLHGFTVFVTRRGYDQIFMSAYGGGSMHIIATEPGIRNDWNGGTHMTFEDIGIMRTLPNCYIIDITDNVMLDKVLRQTQDMKGVFYYRMPTHEIVKVYAEDCDMTVGKGNVLVEGTDATIIAAGLLVPEALEAAKMLKEEGISVRVVDMFTIKPLDEELVIDCAKKTGAIVTGENHSVYCGLGEAVARCLGENCPVPLKTVGVKDEFGEVGPQTYLRERFGFTAANLVKNVKEAIAMK